MDTRPKSTPKDNEKRLYEKNAFAKDLRKVSERNVKFVNLELTEDEFKELRKKELLKTMTQEEVDKLMALEDSGAIVSSDELPKEIFPPGVYATDPPSNYHINYDANGNAKILFNRNMLKEAMFDTMDFEGTKKAFGDLIDFIVRANQCDGVVLNFDKGVDQRSLLIAMQACLDKGVRCELSEKTKEHMQTWSVKERERWFQFQRDINKHAKKCQMIVDIDSKSIKKHAEEIEKTEKLTVRKDDPALTDEENEKLRAEDNKKLTAELFKNRSDTSVSKEHLADLGKTLDGIESRIKTLESKKSALESKLTSMADVLDDPNMLETTIKVPKNWGETHDDVMGDAFKSPTNFLKAVVTIPTYVLPVIGALPHLLHSKFASRTREAKAGNADPGGVITKLEDSWTTSKAEVEKMVTAVQAEINDLIKRQELVKTEITRLTSIEVERMLFTGTPDEKRDFDAKMDAEVAALQKEIEDLNNALGEKDPTKRKTLEDALAKAPELARQHEEERKLNADEIVVNNGKLEKARTSLETMKAEVERLRVDLDGAGPKLDAMKAELAAKGGPLSEAAKDEYYALKDKAEALFREGGDGLTDPAELMRLSELEAAMELQGKIRTLETKITRNNELKIQINETQANITTLEAKRDKLQLQKNNLDIQDPATFAAKLTSIETQHEAAANELKEVKAERAEYLSLKAKAKTLEDGLTDPAELDRLAELGAKGAGKDERIEKAQEKVAKLEAEKTSLEKEKEKVELRDPKYIKEQLGLTGDERKEAEEKVKAAGMRLNGGVTDPAKQKEIADKVKELSKKDDDIKKAIDKNKTSADDMKKKMDAMEEKIKEARVKADSAPKAKK